MAQTRWSGHWLSPSPSSVFPCITVLTLALFYGASLSQPPSLASPWMGDVSFPGLYSNPNEDSDWPCCAKCSWLNISPRPTPGHGEPVQESGWHSSKQPQWGVGSNFCTEPTEEGWQPLLDKISVQIVAPSHCNELLKNRVGLSCQFECFLR